MVDLMDCLRNLLFFDFLFIYSCTNFNSSIICCLSSGAMYRFLVLLFHYQHHHVLRATLLRTFLKHSLFYLQFCYQLNRQLLLLFFELLFLKQFVLHQLQIFQHYQEVFDYICRYFSYVFSKRQKSTSFYINYVPRFN